MGVSLKASCENNGSRSGSQWELVGAKFHNLLLCIRLPAKNSGSRNGSQWEPLGIKFHNLVFCLKLPAKNNGSRNGSQWEPVGIKFHNLVFCLKLPTKNNGSQSGSHLFSFVKQNTRSLNHRRCWAKRLLEPTTCRTCYTYAAAKKTPRNAQQGSQVPRRARGACTRAPRGWNMHTSSKRTAGFTPHYISGG